MRTVEIGKKSFTWWPRLHTLSVFQREYEKRRAMHCLDCHLFHHGSNSGEPSATEKSNGGRDRMTKKQAGRRRAQRSYFCRKNFYTLGQGPGVDQNADRFPYQLSRIFYLVWRKICSFWTISLYQMPPKVNSALFNSVWYISCKWAFVLMKGLMLAMVYSRLNKKMAQGNH